MDAGHGVYANPLRGLKVDSLRRATGGAKSCGDGGIRTRSDLLPARSWGGGGIQTRGGLHDAKSWGGGSNQTRGDLLTTTGNELWSSAGARESPADDAAASCVYDRFIGTVLLNV